MVTTSARRGRVKSSVESDVTANQKSDISEIRDVYAQSETLGVGCFGFWWHCYDRKATALCLGATVLADFERNQITEGADVLVRVGNREIDGYLDAAEDLGVDLAPLFDAQAVSGPPVSDDAFEHLAGKLCDGVRANIDGIDGVMLGLHGAMLTESIDDAEGEILTRVREIVGPRLPVAATLDLHTHMTDRMVEMADIVVGYQTCPHVDLRRTRASGHGDPCANPQRRGEPCLCLPARSGC